MHDMGDDISKNRLSGYPRYRPVFRLINFEDYFFLYPPSSGIASCVGTAGTLHDAYTWCSPTISSRAGFDLGCKF